MESMPWSRSFPRGVPPSYPVPPVTLDRLLDDAAQDFPLGVALIHRGRHLTWRHVQDQADRFAAALAALGVGPGTNVLVALGRTPQAMIALFAVWRLGATAVVTDPEGSTDTIAGLAGSARCPVVIMQERPSAAAGRLPLETQIITTGAEDVLPFPRNVAVAVRRRVRRTPAPGVRMMALIRRHAPLGTVHPDPPSHVDSLAAVFFLGEETYRYTHHQLLSAAFHLRLWMPDVVAGSERVLSTLAAHTPLGLTAMATMPALAAATTILVGAQDTKQLRRAVRAHDPTIAMTGRDPTASTLLTSTAPALRICLQAGPCSPVEVAEAEQRTGARIRGWWAPTESAGIVLAEPVYGLTKPDTVGIPVTDTRAAITDPHSAAVDAPGRSRHREGVLWISGPQLTADGWCRTGVAASMDPDGFVRLRSSVAGD